jgi:hypothetical protein
MGIFRDANGDEWNVQLDAFGIEHVKKETGLDLADISASGWLTIETDGAAVGRVLAVLCGEQILSRRSIARDFVRQVRGEAITRGRQVLLAEGADFFPASDWYEILLNWRKRREAKSQTSQLEVIGLDNAAKILPLAEAFMRLDALTQQRLVRDATASTDSPSLDKTTSASGQESIPPTSAIDWLASAESPPTVSRSESSG